MPLWIRLRHVNSGATKGNPRLMEWEHAVLLMVFGVVLAQPTNALWRLEHEDLWGSIIFVVGLARFGSLLVNGYMQRTTSSIRAASAILSSMIFVIIGLGYIWSGRLDWEAALFPIIGLFEIFNYGRAMRDVGRAS